MAHPMAARPIGARLITSLPVRASTRPSVAPVAASLGGFGFAGPSPTTTATTSTTTAVACSRPSLGASSAPFSTSAARCKRTRDNSRNRGVSSLYRSGPRQALSVSGLELPTPSDYKPEITMDEKHGLWGFFPRPKTLMNTPEEESQHGRAWVVQELRQKSWEDLHALWWQCVKERNRLATAARERMFSKMGFGDAEGDERDAEVRKTMQRIKHTLTERYYAWEDARELAKTDPEIDLSGKRKFRPRESQFESEPETEREVEREAEKETETEEVQAQAQAQESSSAPKKAQRAKTPRAKTPRAKATVVDVEEPLPKDQSSSRTASI